MRRSQSLAPTRRPSVLHPRRLAPVAGAALLSAGSAAAQVATELTFSLDFQGPTIATPGSTVGTPISDADILQRRGGPFTPQSPRILVPGSFLDAYLQCGGHVPGVSCGLEINALSYGRDARLRPDPNYKFTVYISVDEWAQGTPSPVGTLVPTVFSEAQNLEAAADIYGRRFQGPGPFPLTPGIPIGVADGDGRPSGPQEPAFIGLGLLEPIPPSQTAADAGDNVDAFDLGRPLDLANDRIYFSLQGAFPLCNEPAVPLVNSADLQQVVSGGPRARSADVLVFVPGVGVDRYAAAQELGLDRLVDGSDDIDALVVVENGVPGYQPPTAPYSWLGANPTDLLMFSVRCGSDVVGSPDQGTQTPITEGDVLITFAGHARPTIFIGAESLGLATVSRGAPSNDELDGLDMSDISEDPFADCNYNGIEDSQDIEDMTSDDVDLNGIPDECEMPGTVFCTCENTFEAPCGNVAGVGEGCLSALGYGAKLVGGGTSSVSTDALTLQMSQLPPSQFALVFLSNTFVSAPLQNGRLCLGGTIRRMGVVGVDPTGNAGYGPGLIAAALGLAPSANLAVGSTWGFQAWYRDFGGPCPSAVSNLTNGLAVTFTP